MKIHKGIIYTTTIIADKGKKFDIGLIEKANIIDKYELATLNFISDGHAIKWKSTIDHSEIPDETYKEFRKTQINI